MLRTGSPSLSPAPEKLKGDRVFRDGNLVRQEYVVGKKYPFRNPHFAFKLDLGLIWESNRRYTGPLRDEDFHNYTLVFRPNLQF